MKSWLFVPLLFLAAASQAILADVKVYCSDSTGSPCTSAVACNATIWNENMSALVANQSMTFAAGGFFNISVNNVTGKYAGYALCTSAGAAQSTDISFEIKADDMAAVAIVLGFAVLASLFYIASKEMTAWGRNVQAFLLFTSVLFVGMLVVSMIDISALAGMTDTLATANIALLLMILTITGMTILFVAKMLGARLKEIERLNGRSSSRDDA